MPHEFYTRVGNRILPTYLLIEDEEKRAKAQARHETWEETGIDPEAEEETAVAPEAQTESLTTDPTTNGNDQKDTTGEAQESGTKSQSSPKGKSKGNKKAKDGEA